MHHLVYYLIKPEPQNGRITPLVLHGWSQSPKISNSQLYDNVSLDINSGNTNSDKQKLSIQHVSYIDTSFWSPDRPDLQPLVAKEVAHSVIRNSLGNMSDDYLSNNVNDFTDLMVSLLSEINSFTKNTPALQSVRDNTRLLLRELANDFLAASIKGISYLYALYLALIGEGLEQQLCIAGSLRLDSVHDLSRGVSSYEESFIWYFRLRLTSFWLRKVMHVPISSLDEIVLTGTTQVCDEIVQFLDSSIPPTRSAMGYLWQELSTSLENKINRSFLIVKVRQWREKRSKDTWDEGSGASGGKMFHRSTMRLDVRLQHHMFAEILQQKRAECYKPLNGCSAANLHQTFTETYGLKVDSLKVPHTETQLEHPQWLFRHLYDIPFQCAIMRSIDLLGNYDGNNVRYFKWSDFVKQTHEDMSLGRELFGFALEFYAWARESPKNRLVLCINLLAFILPELDKEKHTETIRFLTLWLRGSVEAVENKPEYIADYHAKNTHDEMSQSLSPDVSSHTRIAIKKLGAATINAAFSRVWESKAREERRLEQLSGYKIKELFILYNKKIVANLENCTHSLSLLRVLGSYLEIRDSSFQGENLEQYSNLAGERFYQLLLPAFGGANDFDSTDRGKQSSLIQPVMITRIAMTNYYTVAKVPTNQTFKKTDIAENTNLNPNGMSLRQALTNPCWASQASSYPSNSINSPFTIIMGQYDAVGIQSTRLPCRCTVPAFEKVNPEEAAKERFVTHFTRREVALPVDIYSKNNQGEQQLISILSISLQRRAMRLNLLYRILKSINGLKDDDCKENHHLVSIESCIQCLISNHFESVSIKGYLTDGWGDLLLVIKTNNAKESTDNLETGQLIDAIFDLQQAFYEDFMVDRTELIFAPECLDYMANNKGYNFNFSLRLLEDRKLESSISKYQASFKCKKQKNSTWLDQEMTSIVTTPGNMDFLIRFGLKGDAPKNIYTVLLDWLAEYKNIDGVSQWYTDGMAMLDKIETNIEKKID